MKENSVFFPLTNPSERQDKGQRLAASEPACKIRQSRQILVRSGVYLGNIG